MTKQMPARVERRKKSMAYDAVSHSLLPPGLHDLLPPEAERHTYILGTLLACFAWAGYRQVMPPLAEYEQTLLADKGKVLEARTFRVMDPLTGQMLAIRSDMTTQVARIAGGRLAGEPLPLRLSYAGNVLRTAAEGLSSERQLAQAGIELIGAEDPAGDAEVIQLVLEALEALGLEGLVVDLCVAGLLDALLAGERVTCDREQVVTALRHKDSSALPLTLSCRKILVALLESAGSPAAVSKAVGTLTLPEAARALLEQLLDVASLLPESENIRLTLDPLEQSGFEYHHGVCFSVFHTKSRQEVGRGGRYALSIDRKPQSAVGATLYAGRLLGHVPPLPEPPRLYVPFGTPFAATKAYREEGYVTIHAVAPAEDSRRNAKHLGCDCMYENGGIVGI